MENIKSLLFLCLFTFLLSCTDEIKEIKFQHIEILEEGIIIQKSYYQFSTVKHNNVKEFSYQNIENQKQYSFSYDKERSKFFIIYDKTDTVKLHLEAERKYRFNNNSYTIYLLYNIEAAQDGGKYYFLSDDFGLLIRRSITWHNFFELKQYKNKNSQKIVELLISIIYNDFEFYHFDKKDYTPMPSPDKLST